MKLKQALALLALLVSAAPCLGQVTISPPSPNVLDTIRVHLPANAVPKVYIPATTSASMAANKITIALGALSFEGPPNNTPLNWPIGPLPAGIYQVEITYDQTVVGTSNFTVSPVPQQEFTDCSAHPCGPFWLHTDMWWKSTESGWGASLVQHGFGAIFGVFFVYATDGSATWYVMPGGHWASNARFEGDVYQTRGPQLEAFDPHGVTTSLVGSAVVDFDLTDPGVAALSLTIGAKTIQKTIQPMTY
jgi:hypothetical protein